jgi:hypothetical protein
MEEALAAAQVAVAEAAGDMISDSKNVKLCENCIIYRL